MAERIPVKRCAIYVRKSTDEGLDMSYNSLETQRDACAAYIASQHHEGWVKVETLYEDGGYSGGSMDRPGLQRLLADVGAGKIDIIVVYKIDRLTRSLSDFARLNDLLEDKHVSFVAVTQQFNTSTSMGRLTLNVLLSFAQFEREVAGERIRDKVAASKKKGLWMGGPLPLGYAVQERKLVIVPEEAEIVRSMFQRYLELRSVQNLQKELEQKGVRSRTRTLQDGRRTGGVVLGRGAIAHMLKNQLYVGLIRHQSELHPGQHEPIIDQATFDQVQALLATQSPGEDARSKRPTGHLLKGILYDAQGHRMQPSFCKRRGKRYHYYTSAKRLRSAADDPQGLRVPASDLERIVLSAVAERLKDGKTMQAWLKGRASVSELPHLLRRCDSLASPASSDLSKTTSKAIDLIQKVMLSKTSITIQLSAARLEKHLGIATRSASDQEPIQVQKEDDGHNDHRCREDVSDAMTICITSHLLHCGREIKLILGHDPGAPRKINSRLIAMIAMTRRWYDGLISGQYSTLRSIATEEVYDKSYVSRLLSVAFLAPDIVERVLTGDHAVTLTPERLRKACPLPMRWEEQRLLLLD